MIGNLKRLFWLWKQCFKSMRNLNTFLPFIVYAILQLFFLYGLVNFVNPPFSGIFIPIIKKFFGESALHYPNFFFVLTALFNQMNLVISGIFGIIIIGAATYLFSASFNEEHFGSGTAFGKTLPKYGSLFVLWFLETALTLAMVIGLPLLLTNFLQPDYRSGQIIELGGLFLGIFVASMFAYTTALIILDNQTLGRSISLTLSIFKKNPFISFLLVAVPTLMYFPISFLSKKPHLFINKFSPEMLATLLGTGVILSMITSYFQIGSITRFYLLLTEKQR